MGFFDKIGKQVQDSSNNVINKTKEIAEIQKNNVQISEYKNQIEALYRNIGEKYCELHKNDPEAALSEDVISVNTLHKQISDLNHEIQRLKGLQECPFCGKEIPLMTEFCSGCGKRVAPNDVMTCPGCNRLVKNGLRFCTYCGYQFIGQPAAPQPTVIVKKCLNCGSDLQDGFAFCCHCGTPVPKQEAAPAFESAPAYEPAQTFESAPAYEPAQTFESAPSNEPAQTFESAPAYEPTQTFEPSPEDDFVAEEDTLVMDETPSSPEIINNNIPEIQPENTPVFQEENIVMNRKRFCTSCGSMVEPDEIFCSECGNRLK